MAASSFAARSRNSSRVGLGMVSYFFAVNSCVYHKSISSSEMMSSALCASVLSSFLFIHSFTVRDSFFASSLQRVLSSGGILTVIDASYPFTFGGITHMLHSSLYIIVCLISLLYVEFIICF